MTDKKGFILNHQDFEPYGPEWEKEVMKLPKKAIVDLYRKACKEQPVSLPSANEDQEEQVRQIAFLAWQGAANAFRMYPDNKHTFIKYWDAAKDQFEKYITRK